VVRRDDEGKRAPGSPGDCLQCGASLTPEQRYCLECGARQGALPAAIAARIGSLLQRDREGGEGRRDRGAATSQAPGPADASDAEGGPRGEATGIDDGETTPASSFMPSPRAAAVAVLGMLGLGVLLGSATSQLAQSAGLAPILLEIPSAPAPEPEEAAAPEAEASGEDPVPVAEAPLPLSPELLPEAAPEPETPPELPPELPEEEVLPEVKHLFLIVLGENGFEESFGTTSAAPYLAKRLTKKGELLSNYYAVAPSDLSNQIALISGQGPTPETATNCPTYADVAPGTVALDGQVEGSGCVYPTETETLASQLTAAGLKWRAYVEDIGNGAAAGQPTTCRHPALGEPDPSATAVPGDAYLTWRNPFVYFHSIIDQPECAEADIGLDRLAIDLASVKKTPTLAYIVPNACHAGGPVACEPGQPTGPIAAEGFLRTVVPQIMASPAYKEGGLIAITSSLAPQSGEGADPSACCATPEYPNLPPPATPTEPTTGPVKPSGGGGRVGMLLISPFVEPGSVNESGYYNHYTLLLTIEELFGLERLGYAGEIALTPFDSTVFNAAE
jgi:hypothetical protein